VHFEKGGMGFGVFLLFFFFVITDFENFLCGLFFSVGVFFLCAFCGLHC
jgi:hypothetical protein